MNLAVLKKTRRPPEVGDIFVMRPADRHFLYGRVINTNANPLGVGGAVLIYVYRTPTSSKVPIPELPLTSLLVPPMMTNRQPWTRGYFECLENRAIKPSERLERHCFRDSRGWYFDEDGNQLSGPHEPVGLWALRSYRTIDDEISKALGIPLAPD